MDVSTQLRLREAQRVNAELLRAKALRESNGLYFYRPHAKQHRFHEMGQVTGRYSRFGNRCGKTVCGAAEDGAWLYGGRVWYENSFPIMGTELVTVEGSMAGKWVPKVVGHHEGYRDHPLVRLGIPEGSVKGLLVVSSWTKANEIFTNRVPDYDSCGELFQLIPKDAVGKVHTTQGNVDMIEVKRPDRFGGGVSVLYITTVEAFKHAWRAAESSDFDFIHYDEPPPQKMFVANKRGLTDRNGKFWVNATPVEELWVNDEFCPPQQSNLTVDPQGLRFKKTERGGDRFIITATIYDNPYISDEGRAEFEASLSPEERECRLKGLPINLAGLVYKEFIYDMHVLADIPKGWKSYDNPPANYTIRVAWDVHDAIPQAILYCATAPTGEVFFYAEQFYSKIIQENALDLKNRLMGRFVADYLIDPRAVIESPVTGTSILDVLMEEDLYFEKGSKDMDLGISKTREKFLERRAADNLPTIYICPTCPNLIRELMRYAYNPRTQRPVDKDDHQCENLRRLVLTDLEYIEPPKDTDWVRPNHNIAFDEAAIRPRR